MKKIISVLSAFLIFISSFMLPTSSVFAETTDTDTVLNWRQDFLWGQNMHNSKRGHDSPDKYSEEALHYAAQQGVKLIRYQGQYLQDDFTETDTFIGLCNKYGIKVMLCIWPSYGITTDEPTQVDLDYMTMSAKAFAERYNGKNGRAKVDYFQLWNEEEIGLMRAKYGATATAGDHINDYFTVSVPGSDDLVEWTKCYKAAVKGIREADTDAKIIINFSSRAFGCVRYYQEQGVDFDYVGWDFYTIGTDIQANEERFLGTINGWTDDYGGWHDGLKTVFPDKDIIICESNVGMIYVDDYSNIDYSPFINIMKKAYEIDKIKAFCTFKLTDSPSHPQDAEKTYGHISVEKGGKITGIKPLYYQYQHLIGGGASVERLLKSSIDLTPYDALKVYTQDDSDLKTEEEPVLDLQPPSDDLIIEDTTVESTPEKEPIVETITIKPDDIYNKTISTVTHNVMPWGLIIGVGTGLVVIAVGIIATLIIIDKKKAKKNSLLE